MGVEEPLAEQPVDRTITLEDIKAQLQQTQPQVEQIQPATSVTQPQAAPAQAAQTLQPIQAADVSGSPDAIKEAQERADAATSLEELSKTIAEFDGLSLKKTATQMVFADGDTDAQIMVIGPAPEAEDDRTGKAFSGPNGILLDRMLQAIGLDRAADDISRAAYLTNMINWRPPGNRTPTSQEMQISLPFIKKHIALIKPKLLILMGTVTAKTLLDKPESFSKLRKQWHSYDDIPALVTYHTSYLIQTPAQKKLAWQDLQLFQQKMNEL
jgi:DNA polymerase